MKEQTRTILREIPWKGVIAILLTGVLISGGIVLFRQTAQPAAPGGDSAETKFVLTFLDEKGEMLEQQQIAAGSYAVPPERESENDGIAFRGWSQKLYGINRSTELRPVYQDLRTQKNAFYMDAQYVQLGEEVEAELWVNGIVSLSAIKLVLEYDPEVLLELECDVSNSPFTVAAAESGKVTLMLDEDQNLTGPMTVAVIRSTVNKKRDDIAMTKIQITMKEPKKIENGGEIGTDSCAVHGDIYLLS